MEKQPVHLDRLLFLFKKYEDKTQFQRYLYEFGDRPGR